MFDNKEQNQPPVEDMFDDLENKKTEQAEDAVSEPQVTPIVPTVPIAKSDSQLTSKMTPSTKKKIIVIVAIVVVAIGMTLFLIDFTKKTGVFGLGQTELENEEDAEIDDSDVYDEEEYSETLDENAGFEEDILLDEEAQTEVYLPAVEVPALVQLDTDSDGLLDQEELALGTNLNKADTDGDGLSDYVEIKDYETDPLNSDTDGDGYLDGEEVENGYNPLGDGKLLN